MCECVARDILVRSSNNVFVNICWLYILSCYHKDVDTKNQFYIFKIEMRKKYVTKDLHIRLSI